MYKIVLYQREKPNVECHAKSKKHLRGVLALPGRIAGKNNH